MPYPNYTTQELAAINSYLQREADLSRDQRNLLREINSELQNKINFTKEATKQYRTLEDISEKLLENAQDLNELTDKDLDKLKLKANKAYESLKSAAEELKIQTFGNQKLDFRTKAFKSLNEKQQALLRGLKDGFEIEKETLNQVERRIKFTKNLNSSIGLTGTLLKSAEHITSKLGLSGIDDVFKDAKKAAQDKAKALGVSDEKALGLSGKIRTMGAGLSVLAKGIGKSIVDPLVLLGAQIALIKKFYDLYSGVNQRIVDQGKQLNISKEQSQALYESAHQYAAEQRNAFVTEARILEGRHKLNEALGTSIAFTNQEAITAEKLTHYYGLNEEQSAHIAVFAREIGQTNEDILNTVIKTTVNQKAQFGGTLSQQKILQKVSSTSGEILTKFKGNVNELTKAVMQADRLGLTLEQVDKIGESLLNFETSIENELKAELLTGKAINVEKARAAALSGDTVKLTNEIAKQVGNIHQFEKMNVIQRQAYAEAFGMNASEMGDMLRKREFEAKLGADAKKSAEEQLRIAKERGITIDESVRKDLEAKSLAELQKYTFEKIKSILERIASGPMATIFKYLEKGLKFVEGILGGFSKMTGGSLGNALGAAILGAPLLLGGMRLILGAAKSIFANGLTPATAPWVKVANPMGGGAGGMMMGGGGAGGTFYKGGQFLPGGGRAPAGGTFVPTPATGGGFRGFMGSGLGLGLAGMGVGLATSAITSNMETGGARTTVGTVGGAAQGALTGAALGSFIPGLGTLAGGVIGGLIGGVSSLVSEMQATREKEAADKASRADAEKRTQELLQQMAVRPLELNVNNDTIGKWNTYSTQNGANSSFA
jgi:hypothetical protein